MAVITLKDNSVVTLFNSKEAIDIIGQELYDFILNTKEKEQILKEDIYMDRNKIEDLEDEVDYLEHTMLDANNILYDIKDELKNYIVNPNKDDKKLNYILELIEKVYEITE